MTSKEDLNSLAGRVAASTREWCQEQSTLWARLPSRALDTQPLKICSTQRAMCYVFNYWPISNTEHLGVDCTTGVIFRVLNPRDFTERRPASDGDVLQLAGCLDRVDAQMIYDSLAEPAERDLWPFAGRPFMLTCEADRDDLRLSLPWLRPANLSVA